MRRRCKKQKSKKKKKNEKRERETERREEKREYGGWGSEPSFHVAELQHSIKQNDRERTM